MLERGTLATPYPGHPTNWPLSDTSTISDCQCYIYPPNEKKAAGQFSDKNCQAYFGKGFKGDCVAYRATPRVENNPAPQAVDTSPCCDELISVAALPVLDCCPNLEEAKKPHLPF